MKHQPLIKKLRAGLKADETGNKANSLIFLHHYGFNIPLTYLVTTIAHGRYLAEGTAVLDELAKEIERLPDKVYAIRSSTTAEDSGEHSFAGQFLTVINVSGSENILKAVRSVWDSVALLNNNDYLKRTTVKEIKCGVIIQEMIPSVIAGVSFSRNPVTDQNEIVIEAVEGEGEELVQKGVTPMRWRIRKKFVPEGSEEYKMFPVIRQVAKDTAKLRRYYGQHIDIEWVFDGKQLYYLQLRQITGRKEVPIYSNRMAKEMLPGQIKPLVWSVNIPLVNGTWINLLSEITGTLDVRPEELARQFHYQTYFNTAVLGKILGEFGMSSDSLEKMMTSTESSMPAFRPGIGTLRHTIRIIRFILHKMKFEKRFLAEYPVLKTKYELLSRQIDENFSLESYPVLYAALFTHGRELVYMNIIIPMLMTLYHKRLKKKLAKLNAAYDNLDFRADLPEFDEYSPLVHLNRLKEKLDSLAPAIREQCHSYESLRGCPEAAVLLTDIDLFIKKFGHLSESGNDFSFPKWEENPEMVFRMVTGVTPASGSRELFTIDDLSHRGVKITPSMYNACMKAGRFKLYREQISSLYIYGYGLFRRLFLSVGRELAASGVIEDKEDIFYLTREEIDSIVTDPASPEAGAYRGMVAGRKREMEETRDIVLPPVIYGDDPPVPQTGKTRSHRGTGTSSGIFSGVTRLVRSASDFDSVINGDVVLIPFSDVSWTPVLVKAGAIVSETGGMLSHCSIIAREMGIPALVTVDNACALGSGLNVTVDGSNGILTVHDYE